MGDLAELILSLFWDGAQSAAGGSWLPRPVRMVISLLLLLVVLGLAGLLLLVGIDTRKPGLVLLGIALLAGWGVSRFLSHGRRRPPR